MSMFIGFLAVERSLKVDSIFQGNDCRLKHDSSGVFLERDRYSTPWMINIELENYVFLNSFPLAAVNLLLLRVYSNTR